MTTISATTLRNNLASALEEIEKSSDFMLITNRGRAVSALVDIDLFEDLLAGSNEKYLKTIEKARKEIERGDVLTFDEVFGKI